MYVCLSAYVSETAGPIFLKFSHIVVDTPGSAYCYFHDLEIKVKVTGRSNVRFLTLFRRPNCRLIYWVACRGPGRGITKISFNPRCAVQCTHWETLSLLWSLTEPSSRFGAHGPHGNLPMAFFDNSCRCARESAGLGGGWVSAGIKI